MLHLVDAAFSLNPSSEQSDETNHTILQYLQMQHSTWRFGPRLLHCPRDSCGCGHRNPASEGSTETARASGPKTSSTFPKKIHHQGATWEEQMHSQTSLGPNGPSHLHLQNGCATTHVEDIISEKLHGNCKGICWRLCKISSISIPTFNA